MDNFPFAINDNPNKRTENSPISKDFQKEREEISLLWTKYRNETPITWQWIVNEFIHLVNSQRKELELAIKEYVDLFVSGLSERQVLALTNESMYICEECQLYKLIINRKLVKYKVSLLLPDCMMSIDEVLSKQETKILTWTEIGEDLIPIYIKFRTRTSIHYEKVWISNYRRLIL